MKVVLFCGGYGMRMRDGSGEGLPKPMQMVGPRPLIWHVMRYYAHFGHKEFILCLGYGASHIKNYFLTYQEAASNDFVMRDGKVELMGSDISDWSITFVDTGVESAIGERLRRVRDHLDGDEYFLANYADVLTDAPLDDMIVEFRASGAAASMMVVPPQQSFHCVDVSEAGEIKDITPVSELPMWENGGFFVLSQEIFDHLPPGGDLVADVCGTLAGEGRLFGYRYKGFWKPTDTFKERAELDAAYQHGDRPWMLWERHEDVARSA
ncbi:glucose-1-phosphate cytidylyltransferase [Mycolicibacterium sp. 050158]|jgi:glucose-1-phosphate cytidylyltransferase|uniref:glucose-1-phosphate cytidylyltransferase n=1 Tax=Mycolicibacterium sp. 050158 TaxID=3090602 RepID=UPI00299D881D|nr:glucose-1-phosphate cytidylyltransferase [Mycolicibacterium sp. 050158]MDX1892470.1 glucose-1-phosphate cytidylyltransferase [Mycolicibacterium sp. 050158]